MSLRDPGKPQGAANETAGPTRLLLPRPFRRNAVVRPDDLRPDPDGRARGLRPAVPEPLQGCAMPAYPDGQPARRDLQQNALPLRRDLRCGTRGRRSLGLRPSQNPQGGRLRSLRRVLAQGHPGRRREGGGPVGHPRLLAEGETGRLLSRPRSVRRRRRALRGGEVHRAGRRRSARVPAVPLLRQDGGGPEELRPARSGHHADQQGDVVRGPVHGRG
jgi:hypothetical protein